MADSVVLLLFCYFRLGATPLPPRAACEPGVRMGVPLRAVSFLASCSLFSFFFFPSFPFFDFDVDIVCFILSFLAGITLSPRLRFLLLLVSI